MTKAPYKGFGRLNFVQDREASKIKEFTIAHPRAAIIRAAAPAGSEIWEVDGVLTVCKAPTCPGQREPHEVPRNPAAPGTFKWPGELIF